MATINGTTSNDTLSGTAGNDTINGLEGNDLFLAGSTGGNDVINGGAGRDSIEFKTRATSAIVVDFVAGTITGGSSGTISFTSIERILTGDFNDTLIGNGSGQTLTGQGGSDTLSGAGGVDTLWGGTAADSFVFRETGTANADRISDFASGSDKIVLDATVMSALGASGNFAAGDMRFVANSSGTAQDASDRIIYETDTRQIWYDADGNGTTAARQLIATLQTGATLVATDLVVEGGTPPAGGQTINGTTRDDSLVGGAGNDTINGFEGDDTIDGAGGNDLLFGGAHSDTLYLGAGNDSLNGGDGDDWFLYSDATRLESYGSDAIDGGLGHDAVSFGFALSAVLVDLSSGSVSGGGASGSGSATLVNIEEFRGTPFDDHLTSRDVGPGPVEAFAWLEGEEGNDTLIGSSGPDFLQGDDGNDEISGLGGDDMIPGGEGSDIIMGGAGNDYFSMWTGTNNYGVDWIDGGDGVDEVNFINVFTSRPIVVDLAAGTLVGGDVPGTSRATLLSIEEVYASDLVARDDEIRGSDVANLLYGGAGNDTLDGRGGNDVLAGATGSDKFVFSVAPGSGNADAITDFQSGVDEIHLDSAAHSALGATGRFSANDERFAANASGTALESDDRVIRNTLTNELWYDADGSGGEARLLIGTLQTGATLVAGDIVVQGGSGGGSGTIVGTEGDDSLTGTSGNDTIDGLGGDDTISGLGGSDRLDGGDGNDLLLGASPEDPPENGPDVLIGGAGNDTLDGGNSHMFGVDANTDTLDGGLGDDRYIVDNESDVLSDAGGVDTIVARNVSWTLADRFEHLDLFNANEVRLTGIGNELANHITSDFSAILEGRGGDDTLIGGGRDATGATSVLDGGEGNDLIRGRGTSGDLLLGGTGNDTIANESGNAVTTDGGAGNDVLTGSSDNDTFLFSVTPGAANADQITNFTSDLDESDKIVLDGNSHMNIGPSGRLAAGDARFAANSSGAAEDSSDRVIYNTSTGELWYDADGSGTEAAAVIVVLQGAPTLVATDIEVVNGTAASGEVINGTSGADTLTGTDGDDTINGFDGNDLFLAGSTGGNDVINGGAGRDSIEFKERATSAITVDFGSGTITGGSSGSISFTNIERILTGNFNDTLTGNGASQTLTGQGGADTIWGAGGTDTLWGGTGTDAFVFREMGTANADRISDFASGSDKLHLDDAAFGAIGAMGNFATSDARFKMNSSGTATETNDRVVFNTSTGQLYYDADGSGSGAAAQLIATVQAGATVAAADIVVI